MLQFRVAGLPSTQGSKTGFVVKSKATGKSRAVIVDKNPKTLKPWREAVRATAVEAAGDGWVPLEGPLGIALAVALPRPASAPKTRRTWPIGARSGDVDKLARACLDALTDAGIWGDDAQVVRLVAEKDYPLTAAAGPLDLTVPGVSVRVWRVEETGTCRVPAQRTTGV